MDRRAFKELEDYVMSMRRALEDVTAQAESVTKRYNEFEKDVTTELATQIPRVDEHDATATDLKKRIVALEKAEMERSIAEI